MFSWLEHLALDGVALVAALAAAVVVGIFVAQWVKDKVTGVPSPLRTALKATEASALQAIKDAEASVVSELAGILPTKASAVAPKAAKPVTAAPAAAAAPAPVVAPAVASTPST
jgi:hypothetical protein